MRNKKSGAKKPQMKAAVDKDMMGMRQTYKQTGEVNGLKSSVSNKGSSKGGY